MLLHKGLLQGDMAICMDTAEELNNIRMGREFCKVGVQFIDFLFQGILVGDDKNCE